jgi:hypothetical protein
MTATVANALWLAGCLPEHARFTRATRRVRAEQHAVLRRLLEANAETEFGRRHGFAGIRTIDEYRRRVPIASFERFEGSIDRVAAGETQVLTRDRVTLFEPTSGSSGAGKLIPSTISLQQQFHRGIRPWIANLFLEDPQLMNGQAYWSVSPRMARARRTAAGIPIGFEDDSAYVGGWQRRLVQAVMVSPQVANDDGDLEAFRYQTLLALLRAAKLRLISLWNPTFLVLLLDRIPEWCDALAQDLAGDRRRVSALLAAAAAGSAAERHHRLWPDLRLISCWADANAAAPAAHLASLFPHARVQGKGLIATEAFVSFPLLDHDGAALAVRSHFLEFAPVDARDRVNEDAPRLADELDQGGRYAVIVTTGGGLYRYRLDDVIEVAGRVHQCPLVRFIGRHGYVSDWFGEKLNEAHVSSVMRIAFERHRIDAAFAMLACDTALGPPSYVLYIDSRESDAELDRAAAEIDAGLRGNFHYDYARRLGQLGPVTIFRARDAAASYLSAAIESGQRAGSIKPLALDRRDGWSKRLIRPSAAETTRAGAALRP